MSIVSDVISLFVNHYQFLLIAPIILAFKAEEHYVGRAAILANTVGMFVAVAPNWNNTFSWLNFMVSRYSKFMCLLVYFLDLLLL